MDRIEKWNERVMNIKDGRTISLQVSGMIQRRWTEWDFKVFCRERVEVQRYKFFPSLDKICSEMIFTFVESTAVQTTTLSAQITAEKHQLTSLMIWMAEHQQYLGRMSVFYVISQNGLMLVSMG